jgi:hypothetical protein
MVEGMISVKKTATPRLPLPGSVRMTVKRRNKDFHSFFQSFVSILNCHAPGCILQLTEHTDTVP